MKLAAMPGLALLALAAFAAAPAWARPYTFTQLPFGVGGLNDLDQIVGEAPYPQYTYSDLPEIYDHGVITYPFGPVGILNGSDQLTAINNTGLVLYQEAAGNSNGGTEFQIGAPLKNPLFIAEGNLNGLNNKGDIVGSSGLGFAIINGQEVGVSVPSPYFGVANYTVPTGINDADQIVGHFVSSLGSGNPIVPPNYYGTHGFLLSGGVYTTLTVRGSIATDPVAINNSDEIVGTYTDATGTHGFEEENNVFSTIVGPNGGDFLPTGLNNLGQMVGTTAPYGQGLSYFATPQAVPEPSTLALLCAGLTGLLGWRSWSRRDDARR